MRKRLLKFDSFLTFIFEMDRGDRKVFKPSELTRGLTDHGDQTLFPIFVFVKGSFRVIRDGVRPLLVKAGDGAWESVGGRSLLGTSLVAEEDGSEYHCTSPRGEAVYWKRAAIAVPKGAKIRVGPNEFIYVASGRIGGTDLRLINSWYEGWILADEDSVVVRMWK